MAIRMLALQVLLAIVVAASATANYWPVDACELLYVFIDAEGDTATLEFPEPGEYIWKSYGCRDAWHYEVTDSALVLSYSWEHCEGGWDVQWSWYDPPLTFLRYPLQSGDNWMVNNGWPAVVLDPTTVLVPAGVFDVIPVWIMDYAWVPFHNLSGTIYFHADLGPVKVGDYELVEVVSTVPVRKHSLSEVKSFFD